MTAAATNVIKGKKFRSVLWLLVDLEVSVVVGISTLGIGIDFHISTVRKTFYRIMSSM